MDRCRKIYAKYIEQLPHCSKAWVQFAQMEVSVGEITRARYVCMYVCECMYVLLHRLIVYFYCRSIFELGLSQQEAGCEMDMPEVKSTHHTYIHTYIHAY